jgi:hypothetical protein
MAYGCKECLLTWHWSIAFYGFTIPNQIGLFVAVATNDVSTACFVVDHDGLMRGKVFSILADWLPWVEVAILCVFESNRVTAVAILLVVDPYFHLIYINDIEIHSSNLPPSILKPHN